MLRRIKTLRSKATGPKARILIGLWLLSELIALPAAAQIVRHAGIWDTRTVIAEEVEGNEPGKATYLVTHTVPFKVAVSGISGDVIVMVERTQPGGGSTFETADCVRIASGQLQTVLTRNIRLDKNIASPFQTAFVTLFYDAGAKPDIHVRSDIAAPQGAPCDPSPA